MAGRRHHNDSSAVSAMLAPPKPVLRRDFEKENIRRLEEISHSVAAAAAAAAEREATAAAAEGYKLKRFEHIPSKLAAAGALELPEEVAAARKVSLSTSPRAKPATAGKQAPLPAKFVRPDVLPRKPSVPRAADPAMLATRSHRDFVTENRIVPDTGLPSTAPATPPSPAGGRGDSVGVSGGAGGASGVASGVKAQVSPRSPRASVGSGGGGRGAKAVPTKHAEYGAVPAYLKARQAEWAAAEEARKKAAEEADVPHGMRIMPDAERLETLALLHKGIEDVEAELRKFKLHVVVPSHLARKMELEARLEKMVKAVDVFSKTRVLVKVDGAV